MSDVMRASAWAALPCVAHGTNVGAVVPSTPLLGRFLSVVFKGQVDWFAHTVRLAGSSEYAVVHVTDPRNDPSVSLAGWVRYRFNTLTYRPMEATIKKGDGMEREPVEIIGGVAIPLAPDQPRVF